MMVKSRCKASKFVGGAGVLVLLLAGCQSMPPKVLESQAPRVVIPVAEKQRDQSSAHLEVANAEVAGGGIVRFDLFLPKAFALTEERLSIRGEAFSRAFEFYPTTENEHFQVYSALMPVPFDTHPREIEVPVTIRRMDQESIRLSARLKVIDGKYPSETLNVDPRHVSPDAKAVARIRKEQSELGKVYRSSARERLWSGPFEDPVSSVLTSGFGLKRVYNGEMRSYHQGIDYRAPEGTPIVSAGAGRIALAKDLYMTGNTVIIDHGLGLFTIYAHLSAINVEVGRVVPRGHLIGLSGMTGRASGPHLHFGVNLLRTRADPTSLLKLAR